VAENERICAKCGRELNALAPAGLCPGCLLARAMMSEVEDDLAGVDAPRIGDYELLGRIARGGMGVVYRARQRALNRIVALKLVSAGELATPEFVERFRIEAEAAASLIHPNIVPIHEIGEDDGRHFFSMRLAEGGSLSDRLSKGGRTPQKESAQLMVKLARAVHYAHQRGVLHRDIKPSNVLLDERGEPLLTDFGLAKLIEGDSTITHTLALLGTPSYISPEQAAGKRGLTTATDVYGLGAVLYEMLAGRPPFAGGTTMATVRLVLEKDPEKPSRFNSDTDRDLETICLKCLEKAPELRYASADALADDLERWLSGEPIAARPSTPLQRSAKWIRRHPAWSTAIATLALALVSIAVVSNVMRARVTDALAVARRQTRQIELQERELALRQAETERRLSRSFFLQGIQYADEQRTGPALAYWAEALRLDSGNSAAASRIFHTLTRNRFLQPALPPIERLGGVSEFVFSRDGSRIAIAAGDKVWLRDAATGRPIFSHSLNKFFVHSDVSTDGRWLAGGAGGWGYGPGSVRIWNAASGDPLIPEISTPEGIVGLRFSPDSSALGYSVIHERLRVIDLASRRQRFAVPATNPPGFIETRFAWSPDSKFVYLASKGARIKRYEAMTGAEVADWGYESNYLTDMELSPDGSQLAVSGGTVVQVYDAKTGVLAARLQHRHDATLAVFSPDGAQVATCAKDGKVRIWGAQSGALTMSFDAGTPQTQAVFSADGRRLATHGFGDTVHLWDTTAGGPLCEPVRHAAGVGAVGFSPTGDRLAAGANDGTFVIWNIETSHAAERRFGPETHVSDADFSEDAQKIGAASADGKARLWDRRTGDRLWESDALEGGLEFLRFSHGDQHMLVEGGGKVWVLDVKSGSVASPTIQGPDYSRPDFSPDGETVAVGDPDRTLRLYDWRTGKLRTKPCHHPWPITMVEFSPDGSKVLTASTDDRLRLWDPRTGALVKEIPIPGSPTSARYVVGGKWIAAFVGHDMRFYTPDDGRDAGFMLPVRVEATSTDIGLSGRKALIAGRDNILRVFSVPSGTQIIEPLPRGTAIASVAIDPGETRFASAGANGFAEVFDMQSGRSLTGPLWHDDSRSGDSAMVVRRVKFSRDGRELLSVGGDGTARLWDLGPAPGEQAPAWLPALAEAVGGLRVSRTVTGAESPQLTPAPFKDREAVRQRLSSLDGTNAWSQLARWFYAGPDMRASSPIHQETSR
jgi:eukaryotic-like serine/threonine-protein kinase